MLSVQELRQGYRSGTPVIDGVSFKLSGGVVALLGQNGAGKTTLLRTLVGQLRPRGGAVMLDGRSIYDRQERAARAHIAFLPQRISFDPRMRVRDFIEYTAWMRGVHSRDIQATLPGVIDRTGVHELERSKMGTLSGGQAQRVALAAVAVLALDEPTVGLDPVQRVAIRRLIASGISKTVVLSTHLLEDVVQIADRVLVLHDKRIVFDGTVAELETLAPAPPTAGTGNTGVSGTMPAGLSPAEAGFMTLIGQR